MMQVNATAEEMLPILGFADEFEPLRPSVLSYIPCIYSLYPFQNEFATFSNLNSLGNAFGGMFE